MKKSIYNWLVVTVDFFKLQFDCSWLKFCRGAVLLNSWWNTIHKGLDTTWFVFKNWKLLKYLWWWLYLRQFIHWCLSELYLSPQILESWLSAQKAQRVMLFVSHVLYWWPIRWHLKQRVRHWYFLTITDVPR